MLALDERVTNVEERVEDLGEFLAQLARQVATVNASTRRLEQSAREFERSAKSREEAAKALERSSLALERSIDRLSHQAEQDRQRSDEERRQDLQRWEEERKQDRQRSDEERKQDRQQWNKRWGELANKQGTLVEDIVAPSLRRLAAEVLACGPEQFSAPRVRQQQPGDRSKRREFDFLYVGRDAVLLNETKSTAKPEYAKDFVEFLRSGEFALYFPGYANRPVVPVFSSLYVPDDVVAYLTGHGVYVVAMGDEAMEVLNLAEVREGRRTDQ
ncbi:MAG: hypothetical protein GW880_30990 [Armatimonadetes bacterium]|nr:hypothetical protein [Armatimonadota bacterium]